MSRWFEAIAAYRLATLRVLIATITLLFHLPQTDRAIVAYVHSSFHVPVHPWVPPLSLAGAVLVLPLRHLAAWALFLGILPRASAAVLAMAGAYFLGLDTRHYSHHVQFHVILLALVACAQDRLSLTRLMREDDGRATCPAWPEMLVRFQLAIVFFYTALDKALSPFWGRTGALIALLLLKQRDPPLAWLVDANRALARASPGVMSVLTITLEFFLAAAFLLRPLWPAAIAVGLGFAVYLELVVQQNYFAWDVAAALVVFARAGDRAHLVLYDGACDFCRTNRRVAGWLDWLRRLRWMPLQEAVLDDHGLSPERVREALHVVTPRGVVLAGFDAFRRMLLLCPGPLYVLLVTLSAMEGRIFGLFLPGDAVFLLLGAIMLLWVPGVSRFVGQPLYARVAATRYRIGRALGEACEGGTCPRHGRP